MKFDKIISELLAFLNNNVTNTILFFFNNCKWSMRSDYKIMIDSYKSCLLFTFNHFFFNNCSNGR